MPPLPISPACIVPVEIERYVMTTMRVTVAPTFTAGALGMIDTMLTGFGLPPPSSGAQGESPSPPQAAIANARQAAAAALVGRVRGSFSYDRHTRRRGRERLVSTTESFERSCDARTIQSPARVLLGRSTYPRGRKCPGGAIIRRLSRACGIRSIRARQSTAYSFLETMPGLNLAFWRKWHRWIAWPATIFLLWAAATGVLVAFTEFFGADEALREATRDMISTVTVSSPSAAWSEPIARAFATAATRAKGAPVDKVEVQLKGAQPTVAIFTGKPTGGEDRKLVFDARTGLLLSEESYADKPLLYRLHSGEAFGDGGLVVAMLWGLALLTLTITGLIIYLKLWRPGQTGVRKVFW